MDTQIDSQSSLAFCPTLAHMVATGQAIGRSGARVSAPGLSSNNSLLILRNLQRTLRPARTIEIGFGFGASSLVFMQTHKDLGHPPGKRHVSIDPFARDWDECGIVAVEKAGLIEWLDFRAEFSCLELPRLVAAGDRFDLAYIDGSHLFEDAFIDIYYVARLLNIGGVVVFDDSSTKDVQKVIRFIRANWADGLKELDLVEYRPDKGKSLKYQVARQLGRTQLTAFTKIADVGRPANSSLRNF